MTDLIDTGEDPPTPPPSATGVAEGPPPGYIDSGWAGPVGLIQAGLEALGDPLAPDYPTIVGPVYYDDRAFVTLRGLVAYPSPDACADLGPEVRRLILGEII